MLLAVVACAVSLAPGAADDTSRGSSSFFVWHITDVHVDPWYVVNADASSCYCETAASCPRIGAKCGLQAPNASTSARAWGNSEGNCATPKRLYESAVAFMAKTKVTPLVYFTGDFAEAGASYACSDESPAQRQILDVMAYDWRTIKAAFGPNANVSVYGSLGNHDSAPGDVFYGMNDAPGGGRQSWQYDNLTSLWRGDLGLDADPKARATLARGGYYAVRATTPDGAHNLTVVSLNVNYWVGQNPEAGKPNSTAAQEGARQLAWLEQELDAARRRGDAVHILGHQPPSEAGAPTPIWLPGYWARYTALCSDYADTIRGQFYGHIHIDQWTLTRDCPPPPPDSAPWKETTGIKWCSGGGNYAPGDAFGAGVDGLCPLVPEDWNVEQAVSGCTAVCNATNATACVGYTMYFRGATAGAPGAGTPRECCFRTLSTDSKPADPASTARCYEKPSAARGACDGPATTLLLPGPSLTQGYPATNPAVRLLEFDAESMALLDAHTYTADLHAANGHSGAAAGALDWQLEYSFRDTFGVPDMSAASMEALHQRLASDAGNAVWERYRGMGDGSYFVGQYTSRTAPFAPATPPTACESDCRATFIGQLNATAFRP